MVIAATALLTGSAIAGPPPVECFLEPSCVGVDEGEPCDEVGPDVVNGGCNTTPNVFGTTKIDAVVCGTTWASNGARDSDWWVFENTVLNAYRVSIRAEVDTAALIVRLSPGGACPVVSVPDDALAFSGTCDAVHESSDVVLDPGDYALVVAPANPDGSGIFDGFPCPDGTVTNNAYAAIVCNIPISAPPLPWDLNHNCVVDFADILEVIGHWGPCPVAADAPATIADGAMTNQRALDRSNRPVDRSDAPRTDALPVQRIVDLRRRHRSGMMLQGSGDAPGTGPTITGAQILAGPVAISGDTTDNTDLFDVGPLTVPPTDCGASTAPDAWYTIDIEPSTGPIGIDVDLCETSTGGGGTLYDSKIYVLDASDTPLQCNDETGCATPGAGPSTILNLVLEPGTYELAIDGFGSAAGPYAGEIRQFEPPMCFLDPPCTGPSEGEVCDERVPDNFNGGCNSTPEAFSVAALDVPVCGTNWGNNGTRDTDWWAFNVTAIDAFQLEVRAETDTVVFLAQMSAGGVCPVIGIPSGDVAFSGDCDAIHTTSASNNYVLNTGDYIMFVGTGNPDGSGVFDGFPCPDGITTSNAYEVTIGRVPLPPPPCPWDLNVNNVVDFADILQVIEHWGIDGCIQPPAECF